MVFFSGICVKTSGSRTASPVSAAGRGGFGVSRSQSAEVELAPLRLGKRPVGAGAPFVGAHQPVAHRRLVHDSVVDALQPVVVPADDLVVILVEGSFQMRRSGEDELARRS